MEKLSEQFIFLVAKEKNIDIPSAINLIDNCIKKISIQKNIPYNVIYNTLSENKNMFRTLKGKCSNSTLEECRTLCDCVVFEGKCYPKKFEEADIMNEDPDKYIKKLHTNQLRDLMKLASYLYYNFDGGGLTDNTFDAIEHEYKKRANIKGRAYEKIGAPPVDKIREKLPYPMASLAKVKPNTRELFNFIRSGQNILWSVKLDGVSGLVLYENGKVNKIFTRGDGEIGGNITYMKDIVKFPEIKEDKYKNIVVRGEFIIRKDKWQKYNETYSNARSFVSAKINSGFISSGMNDIQFVAYEIIDLRNKEKNPIPSQMFKILDVLNFEVAQYNLFQKTPTIFEIINIYKEKRISSEYYIDGLVLCQDISQDVVFTLKNPIHKVAFKMILEEQIRNTKLINIDWRISRYGKLIPVVIYEAVYVDGVRMTKATASNAAKVRDLHLGKNAKIKIARSGDIIPTIIDVEVDEKIEPLFPPSALGWNWQKSDIVLNEIEKNKTVQIKRMEHFFEIIGVPGLREITLTKFWESGLNTIEKITNAKEERFIMKGIGKPSAAKHYNNIHTIMRKTRIDRFVAASTTLKSGIGRKLIKTLSRYHPSFMEDDMDKLERILPQKSIPGFGKERIKNIIENLPNFKKFLFSLNEEDIKHAIEEDKKRQKNTKKNPKIKGKTFVFTGFLMKKDYDLEDIIYDNWGIISNTVTSSTTAVISANIASETSKTVDALKLGVPVYSIEEFLLEFNVDFKIPEEKTVDNFSEI